MHSVLDVVMMVMNMDNVVPKVEMQSTSLAFRVSVLTITPPRLPDATPLPHSYLCIILEYNTIGHQYFCSKWYNSAMALTSLHGGAASGLKSVTSHH